MSPMGTVSKPSKLGPVPALPSVSMSRLKNSEPGPGLALGSPGRRWLTVTSVTWALRVNAVPSSAVPAKEIVAGVLLLVGAACATWGTAVQAHSVQAPAITALRSPPTTRSLLRPTPQR
jgi:hypothetical protein